MNHHGCSKRTLQEKLGLSQNEIEFWLQQLLEERVIYKDAYNKYCKVDPNNIIGKIETNSKGQKFVRNKRMKLGLSLNAFAIDCEIDKATLSNFERNKSDIVFQNFVKIAKGFNFTPAELLCEYEKEINLHC